MGSEKINKYYDATAESAVRGSLIRAAELVTTTFASQDTRLTAIDCGCGAGRDIGYLHQQGFEVHGFDIEAESIRRCEQRFAGEPHVHLYQAGFADFDYPPSHLILANASLFFCAVNDFPAVWSKIQQALMPGGIFTGAFLGERDTMASPDYDADAYWRDVMTVTEASLRQEFSGFELLEWQEHELDGETEQGEAHHWHIFEVTLRRL